MKLTLNNIHHYLIHKGILDSEDVVMGHFSARQRPESRGMFQIHSGDQHLFVKQIDSNDTNGIYRLQRDATSLFLFNNNRTYRSLKPYTAKYLGYHVDFQSMVTSFFHKAMTLDEFYRQERTIEDKYLDEIIHILSILHQPTAEAIHHNESLQFYPQQFPWILNLTTHPLLGKEVVTDGIEATMQYLIRIDGLGNIIEEARGHWKTTALIHGDIKYNNFLIEPHDRRRPIKIIDWEYGDIGDPLWDLAGLFQNIICNRVLIHFQLNEMGISKGDINLEVRTVIPRIARLWKLYIGSVSTQVLPHEDALDTALRYTAVRLLQTAIELNTSDTNIRVNTKKVIDTSLHISNNLFSIGNTIQDSL